MIVWMLIIGLLTFGWLFSLWAAVRLLRRDYLMLGAVFLGMLMFWLWLGR